MDFPQGADVALEFTLNKVIRPFHTQIAEVAKDAVVEEIDSQGLIDTGQFRASIQSFSDVSDPNNMVAGAASVDCKSKEGYFYPFLLEFGGTKMPAFAPFRKSIFRVEERLKK